MNLSVRDVDEKTFLAFKAEAVRESLPVGKALTLAMHTWLQQQEKPLKNLLSLKPINWGKGTERASEEIDRTLYG